MVLSDQARYFYGEGWGRERIRVWSRLDTINAHFYPSSLGYYNGVSKIEAEFESIDSRTTDLIMSGTDPTNNTSSYWLGSVLYDILAYKGVPAGETIQALTNDFWTEGTKVESINGHHYIITTYSPDNAKVNLPNTSGYSSADAAVQGSTSGSEFKFDYHLPYYDTNYWVQAYARVQYQTVYSGTFWWTWTGKAALAHQVNKS